MHRSTSLAFTEATIYDAQGQACAHATGTFKYVRRQLATDGGVVEPIDFVSFEDVEERFEQDWTALKGRK